MDGFYDGETRYEARAYCDTVGTWPCRSAYSLVPLKAQPASRSLRFTEGGG